MQIQINAAARLVTAASSADAGKIVLWIQKATGWTGKKQGKAGKTEGVEFKGKVEGNLVCLCVTLDHTKEGSPISVEGYIASTTNKKLNKQKWHVSEKTGRQTIIELKNELRKSIAAVSELDDTEELVAVLKKLVSAKSKVETE